MIRLGLNLSENQILERLGFSNHLFRSNVSHIRIRVWTSCSISAGAPEYARLANVDVTVLIDDDLDLPENIPNPTKSEGISRRAPRRKTR